MEQNRRKILYHYTDFQAADGILRSAQLRVNNVLNMNDSAEMRHFMTRLSSAITGRLRGEGFAAQADQLQNLFSQELRKEYSAFAACFSFHRDDAAQWERYGNRGRGQPRPKGGHAGGLGLLRLLQAPLLLHRV